MRPKRALDVRCPVFKVLTETEARPFTGGGLLFFMIEDRRGKGTRIDNLGKFA